MVSQETSGVCSALWRQVKGEMPWLEQLDQECYYCKEGGVVVKG